MAWNGTFSSATVTSDASTIGEVTIQAGAENLWAEFTNAGADALASITTQVKVHSDASYHTVATVASDYTTFVNPIVRAVGLPALVSDASGIVRMNVKGVYSVKFLAATAAASEAAVSGYWQVR